MVARNASHARHGSHICKSDRSKSSCHWPSKQCVRRFSPRSWFKSTRDRSYRFRRRYDSYKSHLNFTPWKRVPNCSYELQSDRFVLYDKPPGSVGTSLHKRSSLGLLQSPHMTMHSQTAVLGSFLPGPRTRTPLYIGFGAASALAVGLRLSKTLGTASNVIPSSVYSWVA
jgi:hypothetical protein